MSSLWKTGLTLLALEILAGSAAAAPTALNNRGFPAIHELQEGAILRSTTSGALAKAATDSFYIYGGPGTLEGQFQTQAGSIGGGPDPQGWTSHDLTEELRASNWHPSTINAEGPTDGNPAGFTGGAGNHAAISYHSDSDYTGYGNNWNEHLVFTCDLTAAVPGFDPTVDEAVVRVRCEYKYYLEPEYDYLRFEWNKSGAYQSLFSIDGDSYNEMTGNYEKRYFDSDEHGGILYQPGDYLDGQFIGIRIRVTSDTGYSDEDGLFPTNGLGAAALDNIIVSVNGVVVSQADFEPLLPKGPLVEDNFAGFNAGAGAGTIGWEGVNSLFVGDYAKIRSKFLTCDHCSENQTPAWSFINDGTPPNNCPSCSVDPARSILYLCWWDPSLYNVVEYSGGLSNGELTLHNEIRSPVVNWDLPGSEDDATDGGLILGYTSWDNLPYDSGIGAYWRVRTYDGVEWSAWVEDEYPDFTPPGLAAWRNHVIDLTGKVDANPVAVQVALGVIQGYPDNAEATRSPVYDNVYLKKFVVGGPQISASVDDLASDCFPVDGSLSGSCRFDAVRNRSSSSLAPGDSIVAQIEPIIPGSQLADPGSGGTLHVAHLLNPDFAAERATAVSAVGGVLAGTDPQTGWDIYTYSIVGQPVTDELGQVVPERYFWDLPDGTSNGLPYIVDEDPLIFPGDVIHYYISAEDDLGNLTTLPGDIDGFLDFSEGTLFSRIQTMRGLPSLQGGTQPQILFWNDAGHFGGEDEYLQAFRQNGLVEGVDYDTYTTRSSYGTQSDGLGSAGFHGATPGQLGGYESLVYVLGNGPRSLSDGSGDGNNDFSDDLGTVSGWAEADADRHQVYFGNQFAGSMKNQGAACRSYLNNTLGVASTGTSVSYQIDGQDAPVVIPTGLGSQAFVTNAVPYGGCPDAVNFEEIEPFGEGPVVAHEFTDPSGDPYQPSVVGSVEWLRDDGNGNTKHTMVFPYDLSEIRDVLDKTGTGISARAILLGEILSAWGQSAGGPPIAAGNLPSVLVVQQNHPNPFNPRTRIEFSLPRRGMVSISLYNLRGEKVAMLIDEVREAGPGFVDWDGRDERGGEVASGVYLYRVEAAGETIVRKMALLR